MYSDFHRNIWQNKINKINDELRSKRIILEGKDISLNSARFDEIKIAGRRVTEKNTSFRELFKTRFNSMDLNYRTAIVNVEYGIETFSEGELSYSYGRSNKIMKFPVGLEEDDIYKYILFKLSDDPNGYSFVYRIESVDIMFISDVSIEEIRMQGIKLKNSILNSINDNVEIEVNSGECVVDYIWKVCFDKRGFKRYDKASFRSELKRFCRKV